MCTHFAHNLHPSPAVLPSTSVSPLLSRLGEPADASAFCASYPPRVLLSSVQCGQPGSFLQHACNVPNCGHNNMIVQGGCAHGWPYNMSSSAFVPTYGASSPPCAVPHLRIRRLHLHLLLCALILRTICTPLLQCFLLPLCRRCFRVWGNLQMLQRSAPLILPEFCCRRCSVDNPAASCNMHAMCPTVDITT